MLMSSTNAALQSARGGSAKGHVAFVNPRLPRIAPGERLILTTMRASLVNQLRVLVPVKRTIDYGMYGMDLTSKPSRSVWLPTERVWTPTSSTR